MKLSERWKELVVNEIRRAKLMERKYLGKVVFKGLKETFETNSLVCFVEGK